MTEDKAKEAMNLVGAINAGTGVVSFSLYSVPKFKQIATYDVKLSLLLPQEGYFEQDPMELIDAIYLCCQKAYDMLPKKDYCVIDVASIGITSQRETTVVWDARTGQPLYNALVWMDIRSEQIVDDILAKVCNNDINYFKSISGLPVSPYFLAPKLRWLLDNVPEVREAYQEGHLKAGTVDSWILWNLTEGQLHITDVTNASRTLLMGINELQWHPQLLRAFDIDQKVLPNILSSSETYGKITAQRCVFAGTRITGIIANQQASLLGLKCMQPATMKCSYRSGCFLLCNTGERPVISSHGLITTVACKLGPNQPALYALEGSVAIAGQTSYWLEKRERIIDGDDLQTETYAESLFTTGDLYFLPAFTGLYSPCWRKDKNGFITGLTQYMNRNPTVRSALEAICFQIRDIAERINQDAGYEVSKLYLDGRVTANDSLMQLQANATGMLIFRSQVYNTSSLGVALCAAQAEGIGLFKFDLGEVPYVSAIYDAFAPQILEAERTLHYDRWKRNVERCMNLMKEEPMVPTEKHKLFRMIPGAVYMIGSFAMFLYAALKN